MNKNRIQYFLQVSIMLLFTAVIALFYLIPSALEYKDKMMSPKGIYNGYKYATIDGAGKDAGLYRSKQRESAYLKISEYYPKLKDDMNFFENKLYFVDLSGSLVRYDCETGKIKRNEFGEHYLSFLAVNASHLIAFENSSEQVYSFSSNNLEIEKNIGKFIPINVELSDESFNFTDKLSGLNYKYIFKTYEIEKVSK